jgi:CBS domain-containing protein
MPPELKNKRSAQVWNGVDSDCHISSLPVQPDTSHGAQWPPDAGRVPRAVSTGGDNGDMPWTVRDFMNTETSAFDEGERLVDALSSMKEKKLNVMPVLAADGRFVGTLVRRDAGEGTDGTSELTAGEFCRKGLGLHPLDPRESAVAMLQRLGLRRLPVVEDERLVGMLSFSDLAQYDAIEQELGNGASEVFPTEISERDDMLIGRRATYWNIGLSGLHSVKWAMSRVEMSAPSKILDLPCGHGRVLRFLQAAFPRAAVTASDLDPDAVEFCRRTFGVATFMSDYDPDRIEVDDAYDLIWCGSLLTHIDADRWQSLLRFFNSQLSPSGVLVFTTHGAWAAERLLQNGVIAPSQLEEYRRAGFAYEDYPHQPGYGVSVSSMEWVRTFVGRDTDLEIVGEAERLWLGVQDVFACITAGGRSRDTARAMARR